MTAELPSLPRAVLFDWDNTLVDTWPVIHDAMNTTLEAMGHQKWTIEQTRQRVRRALREAFPDLFSNRWEEARDIFYDRFREIHLERLAVRPGAETLLSTLASRETYLGVVSNKSGEHLRKEAEFLGWNGYFGRLVGATDASRDKPAIDPVIMALDGSGVRPGRDVWFVGDTGIDLECGHNSGCFKVLVRENSPTHCEFTNFPPDLHFQDCHALEALVSRL